MKLQDFHLVIKPCKKHERSVWVLPVLPPPTWGFWAKSPLVRREMLCSASGAKYKKWQCRHHGIPMKSLNVWGKENQKWWHGAGWLMEECWRWGASIEMVGRGPWPHSGVRIWCNSMSGTNPAVGIIGSCRMKWHPTWPTSTSTFSSKRFVEESSPVDRRWGTTGHLTVQI